MEDQSAVSTDIGKANLRILPVFSKHWKTQLVKGQDEPFIQGWYSSKMSVKIPTTVAVYEAEFDKSMVCAWLITTDPKRSPDVPKVGILSESAEEMTLSVELQSGEKTVLSVPLDGDVNRVSVQEKKHRRWWGF